MSKMKRLALAALAAAAVLDGSARAQTPPSTWQQASDGPGRFTVLVPSPLKASPPTTDANGVTTYTFAASQPGKAYVIAYANGSTADPQQEMNDARDALLKGISATLVSEHRMKSMQPVGEVMATEFTCRSESQGTECKARTYWHKSTLYMIGVLYRAGTGSALDTDKFLDSFRITG